MAAAPEKLAALRHLLAERFPTAPRRAGRVWPTRIPAVDEATGGLPLGAITEIVCAAPSCGSQLLLAQLLAGTRRERQRAALIDAADAFDPASHPADLLTHLLWVRCPGTTVALQATDLLARDANLSLVVLDLRHAPATELRRIPGPQWYRLQRAAEPADLALVILTPRPSVPSAQVRFTLATPHMPLALAQERHALVAHLPVTLQRQRLQAAAS
ncbi:MAG TPA: hypothetical protein VEQ65_09920 [Opitutus sp.]|nr:hypothetical protein [Opitutus sp.]